MTLFILRPPTPALAMQPAAAAGRDRSGGGFAAPNPE